jgi:hypothetical protein
VPGPDGDAGDVKQRHRAETRQRRAEMLHLA